MKWLGKCVCMCVCVYRYVCMSVPLCVMSCCSVLVLYTSNQWLMLPLKCYYQQEIGVVYDNYPINWNTTIFNSVYFSGVCVWCLSTHYSGAHSASSSTRPTTSTTTSGEYLWGVHTHGHTSQRHSTSLLYSGRQTLLHLLRKWVERHTQHLLHTQTYLHTGFILV